MNSAQQIIPADSVQTIIETALPSQSTISPITQLTVSPHAKLDYFFIWTDGETIDKRLSVILEEGAEARIQGLFFGRGTQTMKLDVRTEHRGRNSQARTKIRGVLTDSANAQFNGLIAINETAGQSNSFLEEHVLLLGPHATSDAKPNLEIAAPDVKCSHAATTGQIDDELLFYVMSRGLSKPAAARLIVEGFLGDILTLVPSPEIQATFLAQITGGLNQLTLADA